MKKVEVKKPFFDLTENMQREIGDVFEVADERFNEIVDKLPEFIIEAVKPRRTKKVTTEDETVE